MTLPLFDDAYDWFSQAIPASPQSVLKKARQEMTEFLDQPSPEEAADVIICLLIWCRQHGVNVEDKIRDKTEVNRMRTRAWDPVNGVYQHVKEGPK